MVTFNVWPARGPQKWSKKRHILVINVKRRLFIHLISKSGDPGFPENLVLLYEAFDTETTTSFDTQTAKLFVKKKPVKN